MVSKSLDHLWRIQALVNSHDLPGGQGGSGAMIARRFACSFFTVSHPAAWPGIDGQIRPRLHANPA